MQFPLTFDFRTKPSIRSLSFCRTYDPALDSEISILSDVCDLIDSHAEFHVSGFGDLNWPVDVAQDYCIFVEQLPPVLASLRASKPVNLDFYEQSVQRYIELIPDDHFIVATCTPLTSWVPSPRTVHLSKLEFIGTLEDHLATFLGVLRTVAPKLASHDLITDWLSERN